MASGENREGVVKIDDASPPQAAERALDYLERKPKQDTGSILVLAVLAGAFVAFGGLVFLAVGAGGEGWSGPRQFAAAIGFSTGLVLCIVAGAELFTGNTMLVISRAEGNTGAGTILRFWSLVWFGNLLGALLVVGLFISAGGHMAGEGAVGVRALEIAAEKMGKGTAAVFASAILANTLVCLAVWSAQAARTVPGKILAIIGPVSAFVVLGFEHSVANMSLLPLGLAIAGSAGAEFWAMAGTDPSAYPEIAASAFAHNLAVSTLGNIVGGALVGTAYWYSYLRD